MQENVGLFELLPDETQAATRSDTFYRNRLVMLKRLHAKRQAQKAARVKQ